MRKKLIIIGAVCVLLVAAFLGGVAIFILKARKAAVTSVPVATVSASSFAQLNESDIPGRYKYISGDKENFMTLYEDHSFMNKDGLINTRHRWDLTPEGLVIHWLANDTIFDRIEAPGIYTGPKEDGTRRRMERQTVADPAELLKPAQPPLTLDAPGLAEPMAKPALISKSKMLTNQLPFRTTKEVGGSTAEFTMMIFRKLLPVVRLQDWIFGLTSREEQNPLMTSQWLDSKITRAT